jgi:hypothetical protein
MTSLEIFPVACQVHRFLSVCGFVRHGVSVAGDEKVLEKHDILLLNRYGAT